MDDIETTRSMDRRALLARGGLVTAGFAAAGTSTAFGRATGPLPAAPTSPDGRKIPAEARPGGAYDRFVAQLAAEDRFSGVVLLSHRGRTVLSRSYGMADEEKSIRNAPDTAFDLSSAGQPFLAVAVMQLVEQGRLALGDTVGQHLKGFSKDVAKQVNVHHLLTATSGLGAGDPDPARTFRGKGEVRRFWNESARNARLVAVPGSADQAHSSGAGVGLAIAALIVEAVSGLTFWDYAAKHIFGRAGMTGSGYFTTPRWQTDPRIAHPYMSQPGGGRIDGVRNLDAESLSEQGPRENPGRSFIGYGPSGGFATAPDLVRFANALHDGTLLSRPFTDILFGAKRPGFGSTSYEAYTLPIQVVKGPQWLYGRGGSTGGVGANWNIYPDTGWVGVVLTNRDDTPFVDILNREINAVTGEPIPEGGAGGG